MKKLNPARMLALCFAIFYASLAFSQHDGINTFVVIQKIIDQDGTVSIVKKAVKNTGDLKRVLESLPATQNDNREVVIKAIPTSETKSLNAELKNTVLYLRYPNENNPYQQEASTPLLGVYPGTTTPDGLVLSGIVMGSGAAAAGLQKADIIQRIEGAAIQRSINISQAISTFKPGQSVRVAFLRDGVPMETKVKLISRRTAPGVRYSPQRNPCKVFIGITTTPYHSGGVRVLNTIAGTAAQAADIRRGDIITALDGVPVNNHLEVVAERDKHLPGEFFTLTLIREGEPLDIRAQFQPCNKEEPKTNPLTPPTLNSDEDNPPNPSATGKPFLELKKFNAFPNPTFGLVTVVFEASAIPTTVRITDISGKEVYKEVLNNFNGHYKRQIIIGSAAAGMLTLSIIQQNKIQSKQILLLDRA